MKKYFIFFIVLILIGCQTDKSPVEYKKLPDLIITNVESEYPLESDSISTHFKFYIEIKNIGDKIASGNFIISCELPDHSKTGTIHNLELLEHNTTINFMAFGASQVLASSIINNGITVRVNIPWSSNQSKIEERNYKNNEYIVQF